MKDEKIYSLIPPKNYGRRSGNRQPPIQTVRKSELGDTMREKLLADGWKIERLYPPTPPPPKELPFTFEALKKLKRAQQEAVAGKLGVVVEATWKEADLIKAILKAEETDNE